MADEPEGWRVPQRRGFIAMIAVPLALALAVFVSAQFYDRSIRPRHYQPVTPFPAPGVETFIHDGHGDPKRPPAPRPADPSIVAAKRDVVTSGVPNWGVGR